jgi:hypothetical protein
VSSQSAVRITAADFDNDHAIDLFIGHREGGQAFVLWNNGSGRFRERSSVGRDSLAIRVADAADLDADGHRDLVVCEDRLKNRSPSAISIAIDGRTSRRHAAAHQTRSGSTLESPLVKRYRPRIEREAALS